MAAKDKLTKTDFAIAGAASGCVTRMICQPFDVLKIRFQLQVEPIKEHYVTSKYRSIAQATSLIIKEEGVKALWKGHIPGQLLSISYGLVQFSTFEAMSKKVNTMSLGQNMQPLVNFCCGSVAGCSATFFSFPFDVIRTRLVAQSEASKIYKGPIDALISIPRAEGVAVLFRGILPSFIQIAPHAGVSFMCYKLFDEILQKTLSHSNTSFTTSLIAGSLAGFCAKTSIYPLDLTKKRMQIQGFEQGRKHFGKLFICKSFTDCLVQIYKTEGLNGYFKGLSPSLIKACFTSAIHFSSYEMFCKLLETTK